MEAITMPEESGSLPLPSPNQTCVQISALEGGELTLPEHLFVTDADPEKMATVPSLSFFIKHPGPIPRALRAFSRKGSNEICAGNANDVNIVFDLGMKRDLSRFPEVQQRHIEQRHPIKLRPDVADSLREGGIEPERDVDFVMLSHVHWDHVGTPEDFPNSTFVVGSGTLHLLKHGAPPHYPAELFNDDLLPFSRTLELRPAPSSPQSSALSPSSQTAIMPHTWSPLATFPSAIDFFSDGSLYVIDSPGHLPGHINLLARTSPTKWVYLGGDCCHDVRILTGEKGVAIYDDGQGGKRSVHADTEVAQKTLERIARLRQAHGQRSGNGGEGGEKQEVELIVAHDGGWRENNRGRFLPGTL